MAADTNDQFYEEIVRFFRGRSEKNEEAILKGANKKIGYTEKLQNHMEKSLHLFSATTKSEFEKLKKSKKEKEQTAIVFQRGKYQKLVKLAVDIGVVGWDIIDTDCQDALVKNFEKHQPRVWLNENCRHAEKISFSTHVAKMTHSSISGATSIYDDQIASFKYYLTTASLAHKERDSALDNLSYAPVAEFLKIKTDEGSLQEAVMDNNVAVLSRFSEDLEEVQNWMNDLKKAFISERKKSHTRAKQIYWPVTNSDEYHLLLPLVSSSMVHALDSKLPVPLDRKNRKAKAITIDKVKDQYYKKKYSSDIYTYYPKKAIQQVTASNHGNASLLNGKRSGGINLLSCAPPQWKSVVRIPSKEGSLFVYKITEMTKESTEYLKRYLLALKANEVGLKKPHVRRDIRHTVNEISEKVFDYAISIQNLRKEAGWSKNSAMPLAHQLILDIHREDEEFRVHYRHKKWQKDLAKDFGKWLNSRLQHKKLKLGPIQGRLWGDIFLIQLQAFVAEMEIG